MKVSRDFYQEVVRKIEKITKKQVSIKEHFSTPGCLRMSTASQTVCFGIVLVPGASKKGRYSPDKSTIIEQETKLVFFEFPASKKGTGESLKVGKKYQFYTAGNRASG